MPTNEHTGEQYDITSRGTNEWGNKWDHRVSENGDHGYHYSNKDGSYYYQNYDGSRYYNDGQGYGRHTSSDGKVSESHGK